MRTIVMLCMGFIFSFAAFLNDSDVQMKAAFKLYSKGQYSQDMEFKNSYQVIFDNSQDYTQKSFCFYDPRKVQFSKYVKKPKSKMCVFEDNKAVIYTLSESFRYVPSKVVKVEFKKVQFKVNSNVSDKSCQNQAKDFNSLQKNLNACLKKV